MKLTVGLVTCFIPQEVLAAEPTADDYFKFFTPILGDSWDVTFRSGHGTAPSGAIQLQAVARRKMCH